MENKTPVQQDPVPQNAQQTTQPQEKKKSKWWIWVIVAILLISIGVIVAIVLAVRGVAEYVTSEDFLEDAIEIEYEDTYVPIEEDTQTDTTQEDFITWGSMDIPEIFPEYTDGDITRPILGFNWTTGGAPNFVYVVNTSEEAIEQYVQNAVDNGWTIEWEREVQGDEDESWALSYVIDGTRYSILLSWYGVSDNYLAIMLGEL